MTGVTQEEAARRVATLTDQEREFLNLLCEDKKMDRALELAFPDQTANARRSARTVVSYKLGALTPAGIGYVFGLAEGAE